MPPAKPHPAPRIPPGQAPTKPSLEIVDPKWLLKALAVCVIGALICAYATLCLLFYQGRWQLVLHPSHVVDRTPANAGLAFSDIHFDTAETGQPRLTAWWIPANSQAGFDPRYAAYTFLYLHDGSGSLSDTVPTLARLHATGLNIFAIDYRGFGASEASAHPSQERMAEDSAAALAYLTQTRHILPNNIIPYGTGLGACLAVSLALDQPHLPAVIIDNPDPDPAATAFTSHPSTVVPVRLLFGGSFDIATPISRLSTPKLLIAGGPNSATRQRDAGRLQTLFKRAASPSFSVALPTTTDENQYQAVITRFLDQYLVASPAPTNGTMRSDPPP